MEIIKLDFKRFGDSNDTIASTNIGWYCIWLSPKGFISASSFDKKPICHNNLQDAKNHSQADFENRIKANIIGVTATDPVK